MGELDQVREYIFSDHIELPLIILYSQNIQFILDTVLDQSFP